MFNVFAWIAACLFAFTVATEQATAATYTLFREADPGGTNTYSTSIYTDYTSLVNNNPFATDMAGGPYGSGVSVGGLAWDGSQYVMLLESDPGGLGNINLARFDTYNDLRNINASGTNFVGQNIWGSGVSARGLAHDGDRYLLLLESDAGGLGNINLAWFDTYTDLVNVNPSGTSFWGQNLWGSGVSAVGLAHDGSQYLLMLESDPGGLGNYNVARFDTFFDLRTFNSSGSNYLGQNIFGTTQSVSGLAGISETNPGDPDPPGDPNVVPLPASVLGLATAFLLLVGFKRRA